MPGIAFSRNRLKSGFLGQLRLGPSQALLQQPYGFGSLHEVCLPFQQYDDARDSMWNLNPSSMFGYDASCFEPIRDLADYGGWIASVHLFRNWTAPRRPRSMGLSYGKGRTADLPPRRADNAEPMADPGVESP